MPSVSPAGVPAGEVVEVLGGEVRDGVPLLVLLALVVVLVLALVLVLVLGLVVAVVKVVMVVVVVGGTVVVAVVKLVVLVAAVAEPVTQLEFDGYTVNSDTQRCKEPIWYTPALISGTTLDLPELLVNVMVTDD